ncbi:MAG: glycosyltransferase family 4 protein, partial [Butyrivibrio sp.]|nr:glycosyltransferase family 4 protein [Butyrivibrio sp.]
YCKTTPLKKTTIGRLKNQGCLALSSLKKGWQQKDIDIVLTTCPPPLINIAGAKIAKKHNAKLIYDVRDIWPDVALEMGSFSFDSIYAKTFAFIRDYMLKHADLVTAVSNGKVSKLKGYNPQKKIICIPNGFNTDFLNIEINRDLYENIRSKGEKICTYIGNIGLAQGMSQLIFIAEKCKDENIPFRFLVYGSGAEELKLKKYVEEKRLLNFSFEGRLPNKDMRTVLEASDMNFVSLVNSNLKDSVPTKLYEALGVGCPVLLAAEGDSVDVLNDTGLGVAVTPNDREQLWKSFMNMYLSLHEIKKKKEKAMKIIKDKYSLQKSAVVIADEMERLVSGA